MYKNLDKQRRRAYEVPMVEEIELLKKNIAYEQEIIDRAKNALAEAKIISSDVKENAEKRINDRQSKIDSMNKMLEILNQSTEEFC